MDATKAIVAANSPPVERLWGLYMRPRRGRCPTCPAEQSSAFLQDTVIPVDRERASRAGALKEKHRLGYSDAFAAELAIERGAWLVTADPEFSKIGKGLSVYPLSRYEK